MMLLLGACGPSSRWAPPDWGPLRFGAIDDARGPACPALAGEYTAQPDEIVQFLFRRHLPPGRHPRRWSTVTMTGDADVALTAVLRDAPPSVLDIDHDAARERADTVRLVRDSTYRCEDGWMLVPVPFPSLVTDSDIEVDQRPTRPDLRTAYIAGGAHGALVSRLVSTRMKEITIWCGDGCRGIPLPGTAKHLSQWYRLPRVGDASDLGVQYDPARGIHQREMDRKLERMEHELEYGPASPPR